MTAEEFLDDYLIKEHIPWSQDVEKYYGAINTAMIDFAKFHVEAALKAASTVLEVDGDGDYIVHPRPHAILNAYPLNNIK